MPVERISAPYRPSSSRRAWIAVAALILFSCTFGAGFAYNYPPINSRITILRARVRDFINPPPETIPTVSGPVAAAPTFSVDAATATPRPTLAAQVTPTIGAPTETAQPTAQPSPTVSALTPEGFLPTAPPLVTANLPAQVALKGTRQEYQLLNNCGPTTLAMDLTYWGWTGSEPLVEGQDVRWQKDIASVLKPIQRDYNVMSYELVDYAINQAGYLSIVRYGGDIDTVRLLVANGIPVIIERGFRDEEHETGQGWEGHYSLITGYDDTAQKFVTQDSYKGPNYWLPYSKIYFEWQSFNYLYMVVYPHSREGDVASLLGPNWDATTNYVNALAKAQAETQSMQTYEQQAFAWFNVGTTLNLLGRYDEAALAYDQARSYNVLPWRMLWYQTGPYRAYYEAGRYQDVIALTTSILDVVEIEESFYWRGWAHYSLNDAAAAEADFRKSVEVHPGWGPGIEALTTLGVQP
jgi:tetratricopeptide (TPR) repeat protein